MILTDAYGRTVIKDLARINLDCRFQKAVIYADEIWNSDNFMDHLRYKLLMMMNTNAEIVIKPGKQPDEIWQKGAITQQSIDKLRQPDKSGSKINFPYESKDYEVFNQRHIWRSFWKERWFFGEQLERVIEFKEGWKHVFLSRTVYDARMKVEDIMGVPFIVSDHVPDGEIHVATIDENGKIGSRPVVIGVGMGSPEGDKTKALRTYYKDGNYRWRSE